MLNYRPTFDLKQTDEIAGNYYPVNTAIKIEEGEKELLVMTDRSQGGSSLKDGRIELMQNRRLFFDDWKGVNQALNETDEFGNGIQVPAKYTLYLKTSKDQPSIQRGLQTKLDHPLVVVRVDSVQHSYDSDNVMDKNATDFF